MATTTNFQFKTDTIGQLKTVQTWFFSSGTNTELSLSKKLKLLHLICCLQQKMHSTDPIKYPNCTHLLCHIFKLPISESLDDTPIQDWNAQHKFILFLGLLCDDLLWGTEDKLEIPEGFTNYKQIKLTIEDYINNQWNPF